MPQIADPNVQRLAALNGYLEFLLNKFPSPEQDEQEDPLILILVAFQKTLERRIAKRTPTREWCDVMRWAVIEANNLLDQIYDSEYEHVCDWNPMSTPKNMQQNLAAALMDVQRELIGDVAEGEAYLAEELKTAAEEFARESLAAYAIRSTENTHRLTVASNLHIPTQTQIN